MVYLILFVRLVSSSNFDVKQEIKKKCLILIKVILLFPYNFQLHIIQGVYILPIDALPLHGPIAMLKWIRLFTICR